MATCLGMPILPVINKQKVLMYAASGGLLVLDLAMDISKDIFAGDSDLVFGMLCEELGLVMGVIVVVAIVMLILFARMMLQEVALHFTLFQHVPPQDYCYSKPV